MHPQGRHRGQSPRRFRPLPVPAIDRSRALSTPASSASDAYRLSTETHCRRTHTNSQYRGSGRKNLKLHASDWRSFAPCRLREWNRPKDVLSISLLAPPAEPASISYENGTLTVKTQNSSLNQILREISRKTGMSITGGVSEERVFGTYGPAPAGES